MYTPPSAQDKALISHYIHAKDTNRPVYMEQAFAPDARLIMDVQTGAISFPPVSEGRDAITALLVRNFGQTYDNVFTWCIEDDACSEADQTRCQWLVCMTEKTSGEIKVGYGDYHWQFSGEGPQRRVQQLSITITAMAVLSASHQASIDHWLTQPAWPWCSRLALWETMPAAARAAVPGFMP